MWFGSLAFWQAPSSQLFLSDEAETLELMSEIPNRVGRELVLVNNERSVVFLWEGPHNFELSAAEGSIESGDFGCCSGSFYAARGCTHVSWLGNAELTACLYMKDARDIAIVSSPVRHAGRECIETAHRAKMK